MDTDYSLSWLASPCSLFCLHCDLLLRWCEQRGRYERLAWVVGPPVSVLCGLGTLNIENRWRWLEVIVFMDKHVLFRGTASMKVRVYFLNNTLCRWSWIHSSLGFVWLSQFWYLCLSCHQLFLSIPLLCAVDLLSVLRLGLVRCLTKAEVWLKNDLVTLTHHRKRSLLTALGRVSRLTRISGVPHKVD